MRRPHSWCLLALLTLSLVSAAQDRAAPRYAYRPGPPELEETTDLLSCRYEDHTLLAALLRQRDLVSGLDALLADRHRVILRVPASRRDQARDYLESLAGIDDVHPVWNLIGCRDRAARYLLTDELVVQFAGSLPTAAVLELLESLDLRVIRALDWLPGAYRLRVAPGADAWLAADELGRRGDVVFAHADWLRPLPLREVAPNDPLFPNQWHLKNTGQGGGLPNADIRATYAWDFSTGIGTKIAVIDTGIDASHPDLVVGPIGFDPALGAGPGNGQDVGTHGTRCAGVAAATGMNGAFVSGVAPSASVLAIRLITGTGFGSASDEAACFTWAADNGADAITNSWGPDGIPFILPTLVQQAFVYVTSTGRAGKGCPIFWAAGNGNEDIAPDQYVGSPYTIAVGAVTNLDLRAAYSDYGAALDLLAPSSGGTRGINTISPSNGTTLTFGGTSASAPQAAGVAALMIAAAPALTWINVRDILRGSAVKIQPGSAAYDAAGHSTTYGYGRLNADAAVQGAIATQPQTVHLQMFTTGIGDIIIGITHMGPLHPFLMAFSQQLYSPLGSGPLFGVGGDAFLTLSKPPGSIPFHHFADANGEFYWGTLGVPPGLTVQATVIEVTGGFSWVASNVVQVSF